MDLEQLEKLNELKEKGILTQEEFENKKKELLNSTPTKTSINSTSETKEKSLWNYFVLNITEKYACFNGRARRKEYFGFILFFWLLSMIAELLIVGLTQSVEAANVIDWILFFVMLLPSLGVLVRRLHDANFSGWWGILPYISLPFAALMSIGVQNYVIATITIILVMSSFVSIVVVFFESEKKENKYGPVPDGILTSKTEENK